MRSMITTAPDFRLDGRTALVTGAASGIGRGAALGIAGSGAAVACVDLPGPGLEVVVAELVASGVRAIAVPADVTEPDSLAEAVRRTESELGPLSLAVNSAGIANAAPAEEMSLTQSLAMEWADRGIRDNAISPGYTATPMNTRPEVAEQVQAFEAETPLGRMATVEEIVGPTVFLLSDAAAFCTGVDLLVDGGFTCW